MLEHFRPPRVHTYTLGEEEEEGGIEEGGNRHAA